MRPATMCSYCSGAFHATEGVEHAHVDMLDDFQGHPSVRRLAASGYQVITF
jgi:hypothetical protein